MIKNFISALRGQKTTHIPAWYMRQAGRYLPEYLALRETEPDFVRFCLTPKLTVEAALQPMRRFDLDAAILFSDILLIPYMLGQSLYFEKGVGPRLEAISDEAGLEKLNPSRFEMLEPVYEALRQTKALLTSDKALIGFCGAPWTLACYMIAGRSTPGQEAAKHFLFSQPALFEKLIAILVSCVSEHLIRQISAGAEAVQIFDSWAGVLPAKEFELFSIRPTYEIVRAVHKEYPDVPIIGFPKGAGVLYESYARQTKIDAISVDSQLPLRWIAENLQKHIPVQGNLDPMLAVIGGSQMRQAAEDILDVLSHGPLIFGLGHGILPQTPPDNIFSLTQIVRAWKKN